MIPGGDRWHRSASGVLALTTTLLLAACGGDTTDPPAPGAVTEEAAAQNEFQDYCDRTLAIATVEEPDIDFESLSRKEQMEVAKSFAGETLLSMALQIQEVAPEEISADIEILVGAVERVAETGDFREFENPEVDAASTRAHAFDLENCGWSSVAVAAREYEFQGIQPSYPVGPTSFELSNEGEEFHEIIVIRKNDDTSESFEELLDMPQEEVETKTTVIGSTFAEPGTNEHVVTELTPGQYLAVCFIPVGSTPQASGRGGPPHFTKGMKAEFTVE